MTLRDALRRIAEVRRDNEHLAPVLVEALHSVRMVEPMKADDWLATSRVPALCPRQVVIASRLKIELVDEWTAQSRWRADCGTAIHHVFQEMWLGPLKMILGGWKCSKCAHIHGANEKGDVWPNTSVVCPDVCEKCGRKWRRQDPFQYVEPHAIDSYLKVRGRIDCLLRLPGYYPEVVDLKTTRFLATIDKPWSVYKRPRLNDVKQVHWYMDAAKTNRGRVIYLDPSAEDVEDAIIEHRIAFNPSLMHKEKEKVRGLREALQDETRPVPDCPNDRKLPYGDCPCVEVESLWSSARD